MISLKPDVDISNITPQMVLAVCVADSIWGSVRITSGREGVHNGKPVAGDDVDPHYNGKALDFGLQPSRVNQVESLQISLGSQYVVLLEPTHIHVQYGHISPEKTT